MNIALELHNGLATGILLGGTTLSKYGSECSLKKIKRKKKRKKKRETIQVACHQLSYHYHHPHTNSSTNVLHKIIITIPNPIFLQKHTEQKLPFQILHSRSCERPAKTNNSTPLDHLLSRDTGGDVTEHLAMSVRETQYKLVSV